MLLRWQFIAFIAEEYSTDGNSTDFFTHSSAEGHWVVSRLRQL